MAANNSQLKEKLLKAVENNDCNAITALLGQGADISEKYVHGNTLLHIALEKGNNDVVGLLLAKGADVNAKNNFGEVPLHEAVRYSNNHFTRVLLLVGADVNAKNKEKETPLHIAVRHNYIGTAVILLDGGAQVNVKDQYGKTPLQIASMRNDNNFITLLLENGANEDAAETTEHTESKSYLYKTIAAITSTASDENLGDIPKGTPAEEAPQDESHPTAPLQPQYPPHKEANRFNTHSSAPPVVDQNLEVDEVDENAFQENSFRTVESSAREERAEHEGQRRLATMRLELSSVDGRNLSSTIRDREGIRGPNVDYVASPSRFSVAIDGNSVTEESTAQVRERLAAELRVTLERQERVAPTIEAHVAGPSSRRNPQESMDEALTATKSQLVSLGMHEKNKTLTKALFNIFYNSMMKTFKSSIIGLTNNDYNGKNFLHYIAIYGNVEQAKGLFDFLKDKYRHDFHNLKKTLFEQYPSNTKATPLYSAIENKKYDMADYWTRESLSNFSMNRYGKTTLHVLLNDACSPVNLVDRILLDVNFVLNYSSYQEYRNALIAHLDSIDFSKNSSNAVLTKIIFDEDLRKQLADKLFKPLRDFKTSEKKKALFQHLCVILQKDLLVDFMLKGSQLNSGEVFARIESTLRDFRYTHKTELSFPRNELIDNVCESISSFFSGTSRPVTPQTSSSKFLRRLIHFAESQIPQADENNSYRVYSPR